MNRLLFGLLLLIPQDTLQVKVLLVTVGVRVTGPRGRHVTGLKAEDFSVFDDGVGQKIEFFSNEEQPITLGILLDHSSSMSYNSKLDRAKEAARTLVHTARERSEYFYLPFDDQVKVGADFTTEREKVDAAIQRTNLGGGTSLYDAILQGLELCGQARLPRQALVIISDGADQHSKHQLQELLNAVRESKLQIYTIGYFDPQEEKLFRAGQKTMTLIDGREIDNPRDVLNAIAHESGGAAFFPRSDVQLTKAVEEITGDIRTQYTVAFYPKSSDKDTRYHQLRVAVGGAVTRFEPGPGTAHSKYRPFRCAGTIHMRLNQRLNARTAACSIATTFLMRVQAGQIVNRRNTRGTAITLREPMVSRSMAPYSAIFAPRFPYR
jgi:Ca-activated chloride channel family protein